MTDSRPILKRVVLGLPHSASDYASVAFTAQLAGLLGLELLGVFAEDDSLGGLAAMSCVREFRLWDEGWHPLDSRQLAHGSSRTAAEARRLFREVSRDMRVVTQFDLAKGQIGDVISAQLTAGDVIAVIQPRNPAERVTYQFMQFEEHVLKAERPVLLVPGHISRRKGPVVVVASSERDPSIRMALDVAEAVHERLIVLTSAAAERQPSFPSDLNRAVPIDWRTVGNLPCTTPDFDTMLSLSGESFLIMNRCADANLAPLLAAQRGVPVLVTDAN